MVSVEEDCENKSEDIVARSFVDNSTSDTVRKLEKLCCISPKYELKTYEKCNCNSNVNNIKWNNQNNSF